MKLRGSPLLPKTNGLLGNQRQKKEPQLRRLQKLIEHPEQGKKVMAWFSF